MTMTLAQGPTMNSLKKADGMDSSRTVRTLPTTYAAVIDANGMEVEVTDSQIRRALEAIENDGLQQFPYASRSTARGRWTARRAPARRLHS